MHLPGSGLTRGAGVSECGSGRGCPCGCEESGACRVASEPGDAQCHMRKELGLGSAPEKPAICSSQQPQQGGDSTKAHS